MSRDKRQLSPGHPSKEQILGDRRVPSKPRDLAKVRLPLKPDKWEGLKAENVWAEIVAPGQYQIANVPFYAYGVSAEDIVHAVPIDGVLTFTDIAKRGGHSTYRLLLREGATIQDPDFLRCWEPLERIGATFELAKKRWLAVDIPAHTDIHEAYSLLERGEEDGFWSLDEGHCGHTVGK